MDKFISDVADMLQACLIHRGNIITGAITLENTMNIFLAEHFCQGNGKEIELIETVFATRKYTFDAKRDTIRAILLKSLHPYNVDSEFLCRDLRDIPNKRNVFAHYPLGNDKESVDLFKATGTLTFLKVENSTEKVLYTREDVDNLISLISRSYHTISDLIENRRQN